MNIQATQEETKKHMREVGRFLNRFICELHDRLVEHDGSKLDAYEIEGFAKVTNKLATMTYGSKEYKESLKELGPALEHHYRLNAHHPEHWEHGIEDMSLIDIVEMFCDWWAASLRHNDGDIKRSIRVNRERFDMSPQLASIFFNTVDALQHENTPEDHKREADVSVQPRRCSFEC